MSLLSTAIRAASSGGDPLYVEDVFSTYLYAGEGNGSTPLSKPIVNGVDLAGKGGLVWTKSRTNAWGNTLSDTERSSPSPIQTNTDGAAFSSNHIDSFNSDGFNLGEYVGGSYAGQNYASWTFRKAEKFFDVVTYTGINGARTIAHSLGAVPSMIIVKRTDAIADWIVYHRGMTSAEYRLRLNTTHKESADSTIWNSTAPTDEVFSLGTNDRVNQNGGTYVAYLFAHNAGGFGATGTEDIISCGTYVGAGAGQVDVALGWEPDFLLIKNTGASGGDWIMSDSMRGLGVNTGGYLYANTGAAEYAGGAYWGVTATGFYVKGATSANYSGENHIYMAIRRPMKTPEAGTEVFTTAYPTTTVAPNYISGFVTDLVIRSKRSAVYGHFAQSRLTGPSAFLKTHAADAEASTGATSEWDYPNGFGSGYGVTTDFPLWMFKRAHGFMDVVCYTGTGNNGRQVPHNLGVQPELYITKKRSGTSNWAVCSLAQQLAEGASPNGLLNSSAATNTANYGLSCTSSTATGFYTDDKDEANVVGQTYVAYLFASLAGVSKCGRYVGTGTTLAIDCGFSAGARFVMIKRTDSTGDWYVWDTARGITATNDPYLLMNSTAAEVTSTDYIDPSPAGFEISSTAPAAINAVGGAYIYLAIA